MLSKLFYRLLFFSVTPPTAVVAKYGLRKNPACILDEAPRQNGVEGYGAPCQEVSSIMEWGHSLTFINIPMRLPERYHREGEKKTSPACLECGMHCFFYFNILTVQHVKLDSLLENWKNKHLPDSQRWCKHADWDLALSQKLAQAAIPPPKYAAQPLKHGSDCDSVKTNEKLRIHQRFSAG